jgi:hypothetical protein
MATRQVLAQFVGCERQGRRPRFQLAIVAGLKQEAGRQAERDLIMIFVGRLEVLVSA